MKGNDCNLTVVVSSVIYDSGNLVSLAIEEIQVRNLLELSKHRLSLFRYSVMATATGISSQK